MIGGATLRYRTAVLLLLLTAAAVFAQLIVANQPFNAFEDDAYWLVPSVAFELQADHSWQQQLSNDVGERGAISLTTLLRALYIVFGANPTYYILTAAFLHLTCSFLLLMAMRECGTDRWTALLASAAFLFCSVQFHAFFWIIGMQHVLVVASMLLTFVVVNRAMRSCMRASSTKPRTLHFTLLLALLAVLSFNRPSILLNLFLITFVFLYYRLEYPANPGRTKSLTTLYVLAMVAAPAYEFIQMSRNGEGWQVASFVPLFARLGTSMSGVRLLALYTTYIALLLGWTAAIEAVARRWKNQERQVTKILYYASIALVIVAVMFYDRNFAILSAIAENLFFVMKDSTSVTMRWAIISPHDFPASVDRAVRAALYLGWIAIFIYARPRRKKQQILSAVWFVAVAVALAYVNSLMNAPMFLRGIPSRYIYYFSPALFMSVALSTRRFFSTHFNAVGRIALLAGYGTFIVLNIAAMHVRVVNATTAFMNDGDSEQSFDIAQSVADWVHRTEHTGDVKLNISAFHPKRWDDLVAEFIPPANSDFYPLFFNAQAFLSQLLHEQRTKLRVVIGPADLFVCGRKICETAVQ
jgi:hypothetical protein